MSFGRMNALSHPSECSEYDSINCLLLQRSSLFDLLALSDDESMWNWTHDLAEAQAVPPTASRAAMIDRARHRSSPLEASTWISVHLNEGRRGHRSAGVHTQ